MKSKTIIFIVILLIGCLPQISSDIYAPSLPAIAHHFTTTISQAQFSMALFMFGVALSLFFYGPISDAIGRKKPLLFGLVIMLAGTLLCLFSTSITILLIGRFIQGCGAAAGAGWRSIFRDTFSGNQLAKYSSYLTMSVTVIIPSAPALGGFLQHTIGWHGSFIFLLIYTLFVLLFVYFKYQETSLHHHKDRLKVAFVFSAYKSLFTCRVFVGYSLCVLLTYGAFFSWFAIGPVLLIKNICISPVGFGLINLGAIAAAMMLGALTNANMVERFGSKFMLQLGWAIMFVAGAMLLILKLAIGVTVIAIVPPVILFFFGTTLIWPNTFAGAITPFGHIAGYAGATYAAMQIGGGALLGTIAAHIPDSNQIPLALIFLVMPVLAWIVYRLFVMPMPSKNDGSPEAVVTL